MRKRISPGLNWYGLFMVILFLMLNLKEDPSGGKTYSV
jgi:hypothetical protein